MEETERMKGNQTDDKEDGGPNSRMQSEHFVGRSRPSVKREGLVLQSHNVGDEQKGRQKKNNHKAVDNDDGQKPILE
jgi:hypothetical protein